MKLLATTVLALTAAFWSVASGQEMEPAAYSRSPLGTQFVLLTYAYQNGEIFTDSSLPLRDVRVKVSSASLAYGRTFGLAGRQASIGFFLPYLKGRASGTVFEERQEVTRSGQGDARVRFTSNLIGSPALSSKEFAAYKPRTVVGVSITIIVPTGQYEAVRLVNLGSNRWAFKPELGLSQPAGRWTLEMAAGTWLFTPNKDFFGGSRREQKRLISLQGDVIYTLRRGMWLSVSATYYAGGQTIVNSVVNADRQRNSRVGATFSLPLNQHQSIKIAWAKGLTTRFGGDLNIVAMAWQYAWLK